LPLHLAVLRPVRDHRPVPAAVHGVRVDARLGPDHGPGRVRRAGALPVRPRPQRLLGLAAQHDQHLPAELRAAGAGGDHARGTAGLEPASAHVLADGGAAALRRRAGRGLADLLQPVRRPVRAGQRRPRPDRGRADPVALRPAGEPRRDRDDGELPLDRLQRADLPRRDAGDPPRPLRVGVDRRRGPGPAVLLDHGADAAAHDHLRRDQLHDRRPADLRRATAVRPVRPRRRGQPVEDPDDLPLRAGLDPVELRPGLGRGVAAVPGHRRVRARQPGRDPTDCGHTMIPTTTVPGAATRTRRSGLNRPGFVTYGLLGAFLAGVVFPLWWSFLIGSHDSTVLARTPFPLLPGGNFLRNAATVIDQVPFWRATLNSIIVSTTVSLSVVLFAT